VFYDLNTDGVISYAGEVLVRATSNPLLMMYILRFRQGVVAADQHHEALTLTATRSDRPSPVMSPRRVTLLPKKGSPDHCAGA
jgi:hypothetical protein